MQIELVQFIFRTCRVTQRGELEMGELERLVHGLHLANDAFLASIAPRIVRVTRDQATGNVLLDLDYFLSMHARFPMILYPALHMQVFTVP